MRRHSFSIVTPTGKTDPSSTFSLEKGIVINSLTVQIILMLSGLDNFVCFIAKTLVIKPETESVKILLKTVI